MRHYQKGWASVEASKTAGEAMVLAETSGNLGRLADLLRLGADRAAIAGAFATALSLAKEAHQVNLRIGDPLRLGYSYATQINIRFPMGDLAGVNSDFEEGLPFFDVPAFHAHPTGVAAATFGRASVAAWLLGRPDAAQKRLRLMIAATNTGNPTLVAATNFFETDFWIFVRAWEQAEAFAAGTLAHADKHQFPLWQSLAKIYLGIARANRGQTGEGVRLIGEGLAGVIEKKQIWGVDYFIALLAQAEGLAGNLAQALATVERAMEINSENVLARSEIYRIRGELYLKQERAALAGADFREAVALAKKIAAKAWVLRSTTSLAWLLDCQGAREAARLMLKEIYDSFTEGFDTADLKDAKALLDELGR